MMMETIPSGTILHTYYRVERALGSGGFGHVYLAVDQRTNQQCAIKEYLVSGSSGQAQLQHEARVLSRLHHPNLPIFIDAFNEQGRYYIALSYIDGRDLTDYLRLTRQRNEVIPTPRVMGWLLSICDAVHFLHIQQPSVIHRDIKPDNIRITNDGTAYLVDLGNAKAVADGARTLFFARHQGTPGYAPPEQYPGGTGTDARSDVYALGATLYFALTAMEPASVSTRNQALQQGVPDLPSLQDLVKNNPPEGSEAQQARQFRLGVSKPAKPTPRHSRHLAQLATLPPEILYRLNLIIQRAMAMKPTERYQSVADFGRELKQVIDALPASAPPPKPGRPVDPNRTQPDLPQLYETLQAAKELKERTAMEQEQSQAIHCPHCNAVLLRQAAYCPQCGTPLNVPTPNVQPETGASNARREPQPGHNPSSPSHPPLLEPTAQQSPTRHRPQQQQMLMGTSSPQSVPPGQHSAGDTPQHAPTPVSRVQTQTPPEHSSKQARNSPPRPGNTPQSPVISSQGNSFNIRVAIMITAFILIALLILLILLLVFFMNSHAGAASSGLLLLQTAIHSWPGSHEAVF